jgi:hypothetical protein
VFVCVAHYKYLTPTELAAGFAAAPADLPPGLQLFKALLDFSELAFG